VVVAVVGVVGPPAAPAEGAVPASTISVEQLIIPVAGVQASQLKSTFGEGRVGHLHHAIDILAPRGTPVLAAVDGIVRKLFLSRAGGITLYEYDRAALRSYYYAHLDRYAEGLHEGQAVRRGEVIGYVGTTGNAPPGTPHLHFAIEILPPTKEWWKGTAIDPYPILAAQGVTRLASALP
jgi:murein DD-endopeptidase MepM/ murein hydrolase activator NlpD